MRKLSKYMLRRKVRAWGRWGSKHIIVLFSDNRLAIVNPAEQSYSSIRSWNPRVRYLYASQATHSLPKPTPLHELLNQLGYRVTQ